MSKKLLDGAQVYAGLQQVCGELVAEFVGGCGGVNIPTSSRAALTALWSVLGVNRFPHLPWKTGEEGKTGQFFRVISWKSTLRQSFTFMFRGTSLQWHR
jgi:hypothetical protein